MKKISTLLAFSALGIFAIFADTPAPVKPQQPEQTKSERQITLINNTSRANKMNRAPAMPMYGYYDGEVLSVEFYAGEDSETLSVNIHSNGAVDQLTCTVMELKQGITLQIDATFWVEIITESGVVYKESTETDETDE